MSRFSARTRTLQWIDRWIGSAVCAVLTFARRVGALAGSRAVPRPRSLLIIKLAEQGSTVLAHEALRLACERFGAQRVYLLVFEENRFIADVLGIVPEANVLTIRTDSAWAMASSCMSRIAQARRLGVEACVDMEFFARSSAAIAFLSGARVRVGFHAYFGEGPYRGDLFTHRLLYNPHLHAGRTFAGLVKALDGDGGTLPSLAWPAPECPEPPTRPPGEDERRRVRGLIGAAGVAPDTRIVLLNANASDLLPLRRWEGSNYVELARRLLAADSGLAIAFTGAPEEAADVDALASRVGSPRAFSLAGKTTLKDLMALYFESEVLVTNDSGPAHFASLTPIDVVALFGPETPELFAAPGPRSHPLWAGLACSPCVNAYNNRQTACSDNRCMKAIGVERVESEVRRILSERRGTAGRAQA